MLTDDLCDAPVLNYVYMIMMPACLFIVLFCFAALDCVWEDDWPTWTFWVVSQEVNISNNSCYIFFIKLDRELEFQYIGYFWLSLVCGVCNVIKLVIE